MSKKQLCTETSTVINGIAVTTLSGTPVPGSKPELALIRMSELETERQQRKRAREVAQILMRELEIPDNASIVGYLCGGSAKSNEKEITDWVLRVTSNSIDRAELHNSEFIHDLSMHLLNILMEVQHDRHC